MREMFPTYLSKILADTKDLLTYPSATVGSGAITGIGAMVYNVM